jgi:hypothetical protein
LGVVGADLIGLLFFDECCEEEEVGGIVIILGDIIGDVAGLCIGLCFLIIMFGGVKCAGRIVSTSGIRMLSSCE